MLWGVQMHESLGMKIRGARIAHRLTQSQLAERMGISRAAVTHWERGVYRPTDDNLARLATVLDSQALVQDDKTIDQNSGRMTLSQQSSVPVFDMRDASLSEMMSPKWQRGEVSVYKAIAGDDPNADFFISGDVAIHISDGQCSSGVCVQGDKLLPLFHEGKLMKLGWGSAVRYKDLVLAVGRSDNGILPARFGRLLSSEAEKLIMMRFNPEREEKIPLIECAAIFRVIL